MVVGRATRLWNTASDCARLDKGHIRANVRVGRKQGTEVFHDPLALSKVPPLHRRTFRDYGRSVQNRLLVVAYEQRRGTIRIITARVMTAREQREYSNRPN
jgi:uncharacterized DUF497 family protein